MWQSRAVLFALGLAFCCFDACAAEPATTTCKFVYTEKFKSDVVVPLIRVKLGPEWIQYDLDHPGLLLDGNRVELIFEKSIGYVDAPAFLIIIDACNLHVIEAKQTA